MKRWECTVCGYIHVGNEPPDECPRCGADRSKFIELPPEEKSQEVKSEPPPSGIIDDFTDLIVKHHLHPISVHIPNGVLPLSVFFMLVAAFFHLEKFGIAAFYNMIFVALAMPVVLFSGFIDWKKRFGGNLTKLFITKMVCGAIVTILSLVTVIWRTVDPNILDAMSFSGSIFLLLHLTMLGAAILAGYCGGKLVFDLE
jgi:rubredoxin/uncharacterized membrane protein